MDNDFREAIDREQLRLAMQQVPTMQAASVVVALVLSYAVRGIVPRGNILSFILLVSAVSTSRVILYRRFLIASTKSFVARGWKSAYLLLALFSGIVWGGSAFLILPQGNASLLALFLLVMTSLSASTTVSHSSIKWAPAVWIVPALLLYAIRCILDGGEYGTILAFLLVLYLVVMLLYSLKHHVTIASSIALRFENLKLLEESRQDITERNHTEVALRKSEDRLRVILDSTDDGILAVDGSGKTIFSNRRFAELWRIPQSLADTGDDDAMLGFVLEQLVDPDGFLRKVKRLYGTAEISNDTILFKDGRLFERYTMPMMDDGSVVGRLWSFRDVTDRKQAEEEKEKLRGQLQQAMKMEAVGRLAGGVAHDFNNLLTAIMGNISLALMKLSPSDPAGGLLAEANKAAESAASLTQQLLAFSRKQIIKPKVLDLNILIADMNKLLFRLIGENIDLKTVPGEDLGSVKVDAGQFEQILVNLAVNARDAMPEGGMLFIETANVDLDEEYCTKHPYVRPGRFVMLAVSDTGHGMSEEVKRQVFEPFFTTKSKGIGTGLGLATIYGVVKQANGSIEVYSEVGKGTTFKIFLPRVEDEDAGTPVSSLPMELLEGSETVLLVEDEKIVRDVGARILERSGYRVMQAGNGDEAIALAMEYGERIDLLMTDVVMPGMHGRELANRLTRIHPETRVLFTSGYTDDAIVHHGVLDEGVSFIGKPYSPSALAKKVREVLDKA
ncbi:response regulator [Candidatus Deferrimicrobium sp.]|uniref:hybrid sensor histidine kinase/response regulator n=1 Tax=Candidatus Deferrimicrobium sp. TaxID=3060586 RepID=UPI003C5E2D75